MLIIHTLSFGFENSKELFFDNVHVSFVSQKLHFITGENGIGKSTLFTILQGKTNKHNHLEAHIEYENKQYQTNNNKIPVDFTTRIHRVNQDYQTMLALHFTVKENLALAQLKNYPSLKKLPLPYFLEIIDQLKIPLDVPVYQLSGGQKQILTLIMALQKNTRILLLDEPTATLDSLNARFIMNQLLFLAKKLDLIVMIICHDNHLIEEISEKIIWKIVQKDFTRNLMLR